MAVYPEPPNAPEFPCLYLSATLSYHTSLSNTDTLTRHVHFFPHLNQQKNIKNSWKSTLWSRRDSGYIKNK